MKNFGGKPVKSPLFDESEISSRKFMINIEFFPDDFAGILLFGIVCDPMIVLDVHHRGFDAGVHIQLA